MASGHVNRANRPNTWPHRLTLRREVLTCQPGAVHTWHKADIASCASLLIVLMPSAYAAQLPGDSADGSFLHDANCLGCHDTGIYSRKDRRIRSLDAVSSLGIRARRRTTSKLLLQVRSLKPARQCTNR